MRISVKSDIDKIAKNLNYLEKKQIPFAASKAINATAYKTKRGLDGSTRQYMDRPTRFSQNATAYTKSSKRNLVARVYVKPGQQRYLQYIIEGKSESNRVVPTGAKKNAYGNLPRTYTRTRKSKSNFFSGVPKGGNRPSGLYERTNRNTRLKQHVVYKSSIQHRKVWPFERVGTKIVQRHFIRELDNALAYAIRTAR